MISFSFLVLGTLLLSRRIRTIEHGDGDRADRVHRMRVWSAGVALAKLPLLLATVVELRAETHAFGLHLGTVIAVASVLLLAWLATMVADVLITTRAYQRISGKPERLSRTFRRTGRFFAAVTIVPVLWNVLNGLAGHRNPIVFPVLVVAFVILVAVLSPLLVMAMVRSTRPDPRTRQRLLDTCRRHRLRLRGVRVIDTGARSSANALFTGVLPRFRYVFVTDGLLEQFDDEELEAVMAHEIGHARQHHLLIKLGSVLLINGGTVALLILLANVVPLTPLMGMIAVVALPVVMLASLLLANGAVGVALERRADDYAAATAGAEPTARALEKLASVNLVKKRTGRVWNLLQQHPGIEQRIERVRATAAAGHQDTSGGRRVGASAP